MNRVGEQGKGESVWLGWFLHAALTGIRRSGRRARRAGTRGGLAAARAAP